MTKHIEAIYEHGVLRPVTPLDLTEGERVELTLTISAVAKEQKLARRERNAKDLAIINQHADRLNEEAMDVLEYQIEL